MARPGTMHSGGIARARSGNLSIGGSEIFNLLAHVAGGTILDVLRADGAINAGLVLLINLLSVSALNLHSYDVWRFLIWLALGWFLRGAFLLGYMGVHL